FREGFSIRPVPEVTLLWREHPGRTSRVSSEYTQEAFFRLKIRRFAELSYAGKGVQLWGKGKKATLTRQLLQDLDIPVHIMGLEKNSTWDHFTTIEKIKDPQLLIAVYPPPGERRDLQNYLSQAGLSEGIDYWFL
ncbi:MAG: hypothetical protein ACPF9D_10155, partial [Owenweeksia sp.]